MIVLSDLTANTAVHMRVTPSGGATLTSTGPLTETCHYRNGATYHKAQPGEYIVSFNGTYRTFDATTYASFFS